MILKDHVTQQIGVMAFIITMLPFYCIFDPKRQPWWA